MSSSDIVCPMNSVVGSFLLKGHIYVSNDSGRAYLCLGFQTYAAIGFPLEKKQVDGKDTVSYEHLINKKSKIIGFTDLKHCKTGMNLPTGVSKKALYSI